MTTASQQTPKIVDVPIGLVQVLRGPAKAQEASAAEGTPLDRDT
jgi:hypothetical protein